MPSQPRTVKHQPGPRRRHGLTREQIAKAALDLIDAEGLDGLTMQRLAGSLGIGTMTLYGYFRSKDELLDAVIDAASEPEGSFTRQGPWREQLAELVRLNYRRLVRHPALVQIRLRRPILRPRSLRFGETILAILHEAGFGAEEAAGAFRLIFTYVFGYAALSPQQTVEEQRRETAAAIALLPPEQYPHLTDTANEVSMAMAGENQFEYGLQRVLDGVEAAHGRQVAG